MSPVWTLILTVGSPSLSAIIVAFFTWHIGHKTAAANDKASEAAKETAQAVANDTFTKAYAAADLHWARYNEAMQKWNEALNDRIDDNTKEIADAKISLQEADERAHNWEKLYRKATIYLRILILWVNENLPGEKYPPPPPDLDVDL